MYIDADLRKDLRICATVLERSMNSTLLTALRRLIAELKRERPDAFPPPPEFTTPELLVLEAVDAFHWSLADIVGYTGLQESATKRILQNLQSREILEERKLSKTEQARGKTPRIYVRPSTPSGSDYDPEPSRRADAD